MPDSFGVVILCGGASKRMGRDKSELKISGNTFLERLLAEFADSGELLISANDRTAYAQYGYPVISDVYPNCGPMAGLHAALNACRSDALLTIPCDLPLFRHDIGRFLCGCLKKGDDAVIVQTRDGGYHPLCAVYRKRAAVAMESCLKNGIYKVQRALDSLSVRIVSLQNTPFEDGLLMNINTPEEYQALLARIKNSHDRLS